MNFEVDTLPNFDRELKALSKKYPSIKADLADLIADLQQNPLQGDALGRSCYKVRMKITSKGKGKSGGSRVITFVKVIAEKVTLISIYDKSDQDSVSDTFLTQLLEQNGLI